MGTQIAFLEIEIKQFDDEKSNKLTSWQRISVEKENSQHAH